MQHGTIFRTVDFLTGEHRFDRALQVGFFRQCLQLLQGFCGNAVFGIIHQHLIVESGRELGETLTILSKQVTDLDVFDLFEMLLQGLPSSGLTRIDIFHSALLCLRMNRR
ncbi:hypothetical protein D3C73_378850 [compost metagenome]